MNKFKEVYILGIGGSGMSSIAKYLVQQNIDVSGYDQRKSFITNQLNQDGIKVDFDLSNLKYSKKILYIYSSAVAINETTLKNYLDSENVLSRPEFLNMLSRENTIITAKATAEQVRQLTDGKIDTAGFMRLIKNSIETL